MNLVFPIAAELSRIAQDLISRRRKDRLLLSLFPEQTSTTFNVQWVQKDNYYGLMHFRGLDGRSTRVNRVGENRYQYEPGVYGDNAVITERELMTRANSLDPTRTVDVTDLVQDAIDMLVSRELDRQEFNVAQLLINGTISIPVGAENGASPTVYTDSYSIQTATTATPWATTATATPIKDLQTFQQLYVGHSVDFGAGGMLIANRATINNILNNSNTADYGGRRNMYGATINDLGGANTYFQNQGLPKLVEYDAFYQPFPVAGPQTTPTTQSSKFIPNNISILVGRRLDDAPVGRMKMVPNANNPGYAPGPHQFVIDTFSGTNGPKVVGGSITIERGYNGGLTIEYPSAVVSIAC